MSHIGIIGGGISGLTLAFLLREKGHSVRVFEAADQPGGAVRTTRDPQGWLAEWGPNTIIESSGRIKRLISMLDLESKRCYSEAGAKKRFIVRDHRPVSVPESLSELIRTPLLSKKAKWSLLREPFIRKRSHAGAQRSKAESLADFVRRRLGDEFLKWPVDALVGGIYAGNPELLSVQHAFPRLALLEEQHGSLLLGQLKGGVRRPAGSDEIPRNKAKIFSFDEGLQLLPQTLSNRLGESVSYNTKVESVTYAPTKHRHDTKELRNVTEGYRNVNAEHRESSESDIHPVRKTDTRRWTVRHTSPAHPPETFDVLIYAGTAYGIGNISFPREMASSLELLTRIPHPPVVSLTLGFRRRDVAHPLDGFGMLVPGVEKLPILGTLFSSTLFPGRSPGQDYVTVTTYLGGMRQPEIAEKNKEEQTQLVSETLHRLLGVTGEPQFRHRIVWPRAIPQYHLDFHVYLDAMDSIERSHDYFYLAGNYRTGISVGDTINAAFDLAERISQKLAADGHTEEAL